MNKLHYADFVQDRFEPDPDHERFIAAELHGKLGHDGNATEQAIREYFEDCPQGDERYLAEQIVGYYPYLADDLHKLMFDHRLEIDDINEMRKRWFSSLVMEPGVVKAATEWVQAQAEQAWERAA
jgi:hypothetical protein